MAFSGFYESHKPPPSGDGRSIAMAIKTASKVGTFCIVVLLIATLGATGAIRSE
jgi:hypothetical protein